MGHLHIQSMVNQIAMVLTDPNCWTSNARPALVLLVVKLGMVMSSGVEIARLSLSLMTIEITQTQNLITPVRTEKFAA
jgi:hypothetical protein